MAFQMLLRSLGQLDQRPVDSEDIGSLSGRLPEVNERLAAVPAMPDGSLAGGE
jgi:hypothetical protein